MTPAQRAALAHPALLASMVLHRALQHDVERVALVMLSINTGYE